eukprot:COSAG02_NODE_9117_length_2324_cov_1.287191_2_plen_485_part_00
MDDDPVELRSAQEADGLLEPAGGGVLPLSRSSVDDDDKRPTPREDTNAVLLGKHWLLLAVRQFLAPPPVFWAIVALTVAGILFGGGQLYPLLREYLSHGASETFLTLFCGDPGSEFCSSRAALQLNATNYALLSLGFLLPLAPIYSLRSACSPRGALDKLGWGEIKMSRAAERTARLAQHAVAAAACLVALRYSVGSTLAMVVDPTGLYIKPYGDFYTEYGSVDDWTINDNYGLGFYAKALNGICIGVCFSLMLIFIASLFVAAALANDAVDEVIQAAENTEPTSEHWARVDIAACALHAETMRHLSDGWGVGVAGAFAFAWTWALQNALDFFVALWQGNFLTSDIVMAVIPAVLPLAVAWPIARTSSKCDELIETLCMKASTHRESRPQLLALVETLGKSNHGQGVGFAVPVLGVLDKRALAGLFRTIVKLTVAGYSALLLFKPHGAAHECELSTSQRAAVERMLATFGNSSCASFNLTGIVD